MSDGGIFSWKRQEIDMHRGPVGSYDNVNKPLPNPPKGMFWVQDENTQEWSLEKNKNHDSMAVEKTKSDDLDPDFIEHKINPDDTLAKICQKYNLSTRELRRANGDFSGTNLFLALNPLRIPKPSYFEHFVTPDDTFAGICLKYNLSTTELRRANGGFSGTNLFLAPNPLRIPGRKPEAVDGQVIPVEPSEGQKIVRLLNSCRDLTRIEAQCYLELNDWSLEEALNNARDDGFE
jgi:LysM repeat protein